MTTHSSRPKKDGAERASCASAIGVPWTESAGVPQHATLAQVGKPPIA
jgi:hypothetical protein